MDPRTLELAVRFLIEKLSPADRDDLERLMEGQGKTAEAPDLAQDCKRGKLAFDSLLAFAQRNFKMRNASQKIGMDSAASKRFDERFPKRPGIAS